MNTTKTKPAHHRPNNINSLPARRRNDNLRRLLSIRSNYLHRLNRRLNQPRPPQR